MTLRLTLFFFESAQQLASEYGQFLRVVFLRHFGRKLPPRLYRFCAGGHR